MIIHTHNSIHPYQETIATNKSKSRLRDFLDSKMSQNAEIATPFEALVAHAVEPLQVCTSNRLVKTGQKDHTTRRDSCYSHA